MSLPISAYKDDLVEAISNYQTLIVVGDTGSGKTTQIPQYLSGKIAITQPRRIAAVSAATRVSSELKEPLGRTVGYSIRFETVKSSSTRLMYMTDGVLLRACSEDPNLSEYDVVILDEVHERSLETDILLGLLRKTLRSRTDLKLIVMSATLDIDKFSQFFNNAPVFSVPGRMFPVDIYWQKTIKLSTLKATFVTRSVDTVLHIHTTQKPGDILVFLTGQYEIETAIRALNEAHDALNYSEVQDSSVTGLVSYPIYSSLDSLEQRSIFQPPPPGIRKVVFATNIAQTSITLPGIRYVVDSGFVKQKMYDPKTHMDALVVVPVSQAAATQRAGRAGRAEDGLVYRLYSREAFDAMLPETVPEIQRTSLLSTILYLKKIGIDDVLNFEYMDPPEPESVVAAIKQLFLLAAVDEHGRLTPLGKLMAQFPISPFLSRSIVSACEDMHCEQDVITIAAMLSCEDVFVTPRSKQKQELAETDHRKFYHWSGDHLTLLNVYQGWKDSRYHRDFAKNHYLSSRVLSQARNIRTQLLDIVARLKLKTSSHQRTDARSILRALCTGYFGNAAKRHPQRNFYFPYLNLKDPLTSSGIFSLSMGPSSSLYSSEWGSNVPDLVIYNDVQYVNRANMRIVSRIEPDMVDVLMKRHELMNEESLIKGHSHIDIPIPFVEEEVLDLEKTENDLTFEITHEIVDEQHHSESIIDSSGHLEPVAHSTPRDIDPLEQEQESLKRKREEARQRYLSRKKR